MICSVISRLRGVVSVRVTVSVMLILFYLFGVNTACLYISYQIMKQFSIMTLIKPIIIKSFISMKYKVLTSHNGWSVVSNYVQRLLSGFYDYVLPALQWCLFCFVFYNIFGDVNNELPIDVVSVWFRRPRLKLLKKHRHTGIRQCLLRNCRKHCTDACVKCSVHFAGLFRDLISVF